MESEGVGRASQEKQVQMKDVNLGDILTHIKYVPYHPLRSIKISS